ncbi:M20/M25/M40 family metallo-hydrolase [Spiribacter sp. 2438]|uniref:M20/M25/M40 family metallo-hydrolase n=1 Tax=Spiribacter sp. 2438 TaxID=2666185 RepID=UPI0012B14F47|nr:M20/M25/M40 family metallo-hydrolase [Spiribacter sp. 2438]QGM21552.1 M20/M25/M40 family metallo-hydrolase [Spiribacter sp. 2438]
MADNAKPWAASMPDAQFHLMHDILAAPSPIGLEAAMTEGVLKPHFESIAPAGWQVHNFKGHAGVVLDTHPGRDDLFTVMVIGHADKIRMQVRSIGEDGKVWINSDSFLPTTLIGHEVSVFSEDPDNPGQYRRLDGGTVEALGAIHFADPKLRSGDKGVRKEQLYVELQIHGADKKKQVEALGIRPGDSILMNRPIRRGFGPDTFYGAYLDNGLGCFVAAEAARLVAEAGGAEHVRMLFAAATYEEIGRFGSRVLVSEMRPDAIIGVDVNHDYVAAPGIGDKRMAPIEMGKGFTMSVGSIVSEQLNQRIEAVARAEGIPMQRDVVGADTGTDGMAGVLGNVDCAATSVGMPIRNMHTISESGCTRDVLACTHAVAATLRAMDVEESEPGRLAAAFRGNHPRLDQAVGLAHPGGESEGND